jgi:L-amino acid N-acyltransferase YncA
MRRRQVCQGRGVSDVIRAARVDDAPAIRAIYAPFVESTPVSFEVEVPPVESYEGSLQRSVYPWLVLDRDGEVVGWAKSSRFHPRASYVWSVEVSIYLSETARGGGAGKSLMTALLDELRDQGYVNAFAGTTLPNDASVGLFESVGFRRCALQEKVGYKLGKWHDVGWWQKALGPYPDPPPPVPASEKRAGSSGTST